MSRPQPQCDGGRRPGRHRPARCTGCFAPFTGPCGAKKKAFSVRTAVGGCQVKRQGCVAHKPGAAGGQRASAASPARRNGRATLAPGCAGSSCGGWPQAERVIQQAGRSRQVGFGVAPLCAVGGCRAGPAPWAGHRPAFIDVELAGRLPRSTVGGQQRRRRARRRKPRARPAPATCVSGVRLPLARSISTQLAAAAEASLTTRAAPAGPSAARRAAPSGRHASRPRRCRSRR